MNINELEDLTKQWSALEPEEYPATLLELIVAYREAVAALEVVQEMCDPPTWVSDDVIDPMLATAKRLGVE